MPLKQQTVEIEGYGMIEFPSHFTPDEIKKRIDEEIFPALKARKEAEDKRYTEEEKFRALDISISEEEEANAKAMLQEEPSGFIKALEDAGYFTEETGVRGPREFRPEAILENLQEGGAAAIVNRALGNQSTFQEAEAFFKKHGANVLVDKYDELRNLKYDDPDFDKKKAKLEHQIQYIKRLAQATRRYIAGDKTIGEVSNELGQVWDQFKEDPTGVLGDMAKGIWDDPGAFLAELLIEANRDPLLFMSPLGARAGIAATVARRTSRLMKDAVAKAAVAKTMKEAREAISKGLQSGSKYKSTQDIFRDMAQESLGRGGAALSGAGGALVTATATAIPLGLARQYDETGEIDYGELITTMGPVLAASTLIGGVAGAWNRAATRAAARHGLNPGVADKALKDIAENTPGAAKPAAETGIVGAAKALAEEMKLPDPDIEAVRIAGDIQRAIKEPSLITEYRKAKEMEFGKAAQLKEMYDTPRTPTPVPPPSGEAYFAAKQREHAQGSQLMEMYNKARQEVPTPPTSPPGTTLPTITGDMYRDAVSRRIEDGKYMYEAMQKLPKIIMDEEVPITRARQTRIEKLLEKQLAKGKDVDLAEHVIKATGLDEKIDSMLLGGKHVVVTGKMDTATRQQVEKLIRNMGGTPQTKVTAKTDFAIVGQKPGAQKLKGIADYDTPVISETEFNKLNEYATVKRQGGRDLSSMEAEVGPLLSRLFPGQQGRTYAEIMTQLAGATLAGLAGFKLASGLDKEDDGYKYWVAATLAGMAAVVAPPLLAKLGRMLEATEKPTFQNVAKIITDRNPAPVPGKYTKAQRIKVTEQVRNTLNSYHEDIALGALHGKELSETLKKLPGMEDFRARERVTQTLLTVPRRDWASAGLAPHEVQAATVMHNALQTLYDAAKKQGHDTVFLRTMIRSLFEPSKRGMPLLIKEIKNHTDLFEGIRAVHNNPNLRNLMDSNIDAAFLVARGFEAFHAALAQHKVIQALQIQTDPGIAQLVFKRKDWAKLQKSGHVASDPNLAHYQTVKYPGFEGYVMHPDLIEPLEIFFDSRDSGGWLRALTLMAYTSKRLTVGGSFFHANVLLDSAAYAGTWKNFGVTAGAAAAGGALGGLATMAAMSDSDLSQYAKNVMGVAGLAVGALISKNVVNFRALANRGLSRPALLTQGTTAHGLARDAVRAGVRFGMIEDIRNEYFYSFWRKAADYVGLHPVEKYAEAGLRKLDDFMWDNILTRNKLMAFAVKREELMKQNVKKGWGFNQLDVDKAAASFVNDAFGGLDWEGMALNMLYHPMLKPLAKYALTPKGRQVMQILMFAPDWTLSNLRIVSRSYKAVMPDFLGGNALSRAQGRMHAQYTLRALLNTAITGAMVEYAILGKNPLEYLDRKRYEWSTRGEKDESIAGFMENLGRIDIGNGRRLYFNKQFVETFGWVDDPIHTALGKASLFPKEVIEQVANIDYTAGLSDQWEPYGPTLRKKEDTKAEMAVKSIAHAGGKFVPIAVSSTSAKGEEGGNWWAAKTGAMISGSAGIPVFGNPRETSRARKPRTVRKANGQ